MTDFETHPAGTAARIAGKTIADWIEFARRDDCLDDMVPSDLRQVISALTRANAATAAAYEVAAGIAQDYHEKALEWAKKVRGLEQHIGETDSSRIAAAIRALATPDQTAALDKLIAEAESRAWREAAKAVDALPDAKSPDVNIGVANAYAAILAAFKPQPDPRDAVIARLVEAGGDAKQALVDAADEIAELRLSMSKRDFEFPWIGDAIDKLTLALAAAKAVQHD